MEYKVLTKNDAIAWQNDHPPSSSLSDLKIDRYSNLKNDDIVAIIAIDEDRIIGRNFVYSAKYLFNGNPMTCRCSGALFVEEKYRVKGVGLFIKMHMLKLGYPQLVGGISGNMQKIYETWNKYFTIDNSPIYALPIRFCALFFFTRLAYYKEIKKGNKEDKKQFIKIFLKYLFIRGMLLKDNKNVAILPHQEAISSLNKILNNNYRTFQIPWNLNKLEQGINHSRKDFYAWVIKIENNGISTHHIVTVYTKKRETRLLMNKNCTIKEAHLNEIFPPINNKDNLLTVLKIIIKEIKIKGFDALQIYAMTSKLIEFCEKLELVSFYNKTISIAPNDLSEELEKMIIDPSNWWCRAISEEQFKETSDI